jgi:hypothetical protein
MFAASAFKGDEPARFAIALAEARSISQPDNGKLVDDLSRRLGEAGFKDWAIEAAIDGSERAKTSPTRWRAPSKWASSSEVILGSLGSSMRTST